MLLYSIGHGNVVPKSTREKQQQENVLWKLSKQGLYILTASNLLKILEMLRAPGYVCSPDRNRGTWSGLLDADLRNAPSHVNKLCDLWTMRDVNQCCVLLQKGKRFGDKRGISNPKTFNYCSG